MRFFAGLGFVPLPFSLSLSSYRLRGAAASASRAVAVVLHAPALPPGVASSATQDLALHLAGSAPYETVRPRGAEEVTSEPWGAHRRLERQTTVHRKDCGKQQCSVAYRETGTLPITAAEPETNNKVDNDIQEA